MVEISFDATGLNRGQRRRILNAADKVDIVAKADAAFFRRRPNRTHRVRLMSAAERDQLAAMSGLDEAPTGSGREWIVVVKQIAPGVRMRRFLTAVTGSDLDQNEATCRAVFEIATGGNEYAKKIEASLRASMEGDSND